MYASFFAININYRVINTKIKRCAVLALACSIAGCKESQFYCLPFEQTVPSMYQPKVTSTSQKLKYF